MVGRFSWYHADEIVLVSVEFDEKGKRGRILPISSSCYRRKIISPILPVHMQVVGQVFDSLALGISLKKSVIIIGEYHIVLEPDPGE